MKTVPDKLRDLADGLQKQIDKQFAPRLDNTPKRQRECMSARIEGNVLQRVQHALRALADARENGTLAPILQSLTTKAAIRPCVKKSINHIDYYHVAEGDYSDKSVMAVALRSLMDGAKTLDQIAADAERERKQALEAMEQKIRFNDIAGFFPTPRPVIDMMLDYAWEIQDSYRVLEPSAGKGDICDFVRERNKFCKIHAIEINHSLCDILKAKGYETTQADFLTVPVPGNDAAKYDVVLMNPPFERGQDADHVRHAWEMLKPGGRLVSVISKGVMHRMDNKSKNFQRWLNDRDAVMEDLPDGSFKSGFVQTGVSTKLILLVKPDAPEPLKVAADPVVRSRPAKKVSPQLFFSFL
jgi:2-polyprenyl-3-methyl-5-hydroxy-6-metoxy-1,4-benzoquinol methylase